MIIVIIKGRHGEKVFKGAERERQLIEQRGQEECGR
jgi:hypothetical protein